MAAFDHDFDDFDTSVGPEELYGPYDSEENRDFDLSMEWDGDDEPADIDGDFGYDPYAGGSEAIDRDDYDAYDLGDVADDWGF